MKKSYLSWKYRQEVLIENPSSTDGFQGTFILSRKPGMKKDFRDLRFSDLKGNKIEYFLESISNFKSCRVWLALPANVKKLYMYYGNGGVKSGSNSSAVFEFYDGFSSLDLSKWTKVHGSSVVSGGVLTLESATLNSILQSKQTYPVNTIVEARAYHANTNRCIIGYRNTDTEKAAAWHGATIGDNDDHRFTHNGSSGTWTDDGVNRGGSTYYIYGVAHLAAGPKFYINYALRGTASTTLPGNVALPIHFYSEYNKGPVKVDWVRVRKYAAVEPTITLGKKITTQPKGYPYDNTVTTDTSIGMTAEITMKYFLNLSSQMGISGNRMFRHPKYYRVETPGPYQRWKFKGDITTPRNEVEKYVNVIIPLTPGMTSDGRDLRFAYKNTKLKYYLELVYQGSILTTLEGDWLTTSEGDICTTSDSESFISVWVEVPAYTSHINYYYGNGTAVSESDVSVYPGAVTSETITRVVPEAIFGHFEDWKFKGDIRISNPGWILTTSEGNWLTTSEGDVLTTSPENQQVQLDVYIPILPGMARDGRDLRFSDTTEEPIPFYIESISQNVIKCIVKVPALANSICFFYGNGTAKYTGDPAQVFDYWTDFDTLNLSEWSIVSGAALVSGSKLRISHAVQNSLIRSIQTFAPDTVLEMRVSHPYQNQVIFGLWGAGNNRACWLGSHLTDSDDYLHTMDGALETNVDDGVTRAGAEFHTYGISYLKEGPEFYVDGEYRGNLTTYLPTGNLPIGLYSEVNKGDLVVDWVRVRKYTTMSAQVIRHRPRKQALCVIKEELPTAVATVERHYPQNSSIIPYYEYIAGKTFTGMQVSEPTYKERRELRDYSLISCDISKSTDDTYIQLSANFADLTVPPEKSTVKYIARDPAGNQYILFHGKVVANTPTIQYVGSNLKMQAADLSRNLAVQKVPWNYQTIGGNGESLSWIVRALLDAEQTGVKGKNIIDSIKSPNQFVFDPKTSRMEAIKKVADETGGGIINIKLISKVVNEITVTEPYFYLVPPESIDETANGFDLPDPITFSWPTNAPLDQVVVPSDPDEKYNKVIVYGVLSDTGETVVAAAYSPAVYLGEEKAREYIVEDNLLVEKGSNAEREAIKWLLYFMSSRATVSAKFINRFDFELYQRVRFGEGFSPTLRALTNSVQMPYVVAFDPRDEPNSTHIVDVSGVPTPEWLRVIEIKYHSENVQETCELTLTTDYIYSKIDPVVQTPYSDYLSPGYRKPSITDPVTTTEAIVNGTISKQLQPETCTVLSINAENKTAVVQTSSGKLVTIQLP